MRFAKVSCLAVASLLSACAIEPQSATMDDASPASAPAADISWLTQSWTVTEAWPDHANAPKPPLGQTVFLGELGTGDIGGRECPKSTVTLSEQPLAEILGGMNNQDDMGRVVPKISFQCDGQDFGSYAHTQPDLLVSHYGPWLLWLRPSNIAAAFLPPPPPPPLAMAPQSLLPPPPPPPAEPAHTENVVQPMPTDIHRVYLASYRKDAQALKGFQEFKAKVHVLDQARAFLKPVDLPKKGHYVRLFAEVDGPAQADQICNAIKTVIKDSCAADR